ncbi:ciliary microtubule inner protein 2C-like [Ruditapes philippinarum]|uniref:ciliary microtubule inner protein 2C-like n=1 Tax=Ruditapes philippinarum TaxID=129788 RepID=UPI00295B07DE|nr:ciliary microtubule inner protein 2C-like [Ruditapes philippinarum]
MSRSAGTLITTHNSTFIPPRFMPGYRGHCPTTKYDYGETYGNATNKYFQDYRHEVLNASHDPYARGGEFPTYYTHKPESVISARGRTRDRWLAAPKYSLSNVDFDRKEELKSFDSLGQKHREHYFDKSNTKKSVDYFMIPRSAEDQIKSKAQFMILSTRHTDDINLPYLEHEARRLPLIKRTSTMSSQRDREMRDVVFEKR